MHALGTAPGDGEYGTDLDNVKPITQGIIRQRNGMLGYFALVIPAQNQELQHGMTLRATGGEYQYVGKYLPMAGVLGVGADVDGKSGGSGKKVD